VLPPGFLRIFSEVTYIRTEGNSTLLKIYTLPNHTITIGVLVYILETQLLGLLYCMVVALVSCRNGPCRGYLLIYRSLFYIYIVGFLWLELNIMSGGPLLRNANDFVVPFARTEHLKRFPLITIPEAWNSLSPELKNLSSVYSFCSSLKSAFLHTVHYHLYLNGPGYFAQCVRPSPDNYIFNSVKWLSTSSCPSVY
jgi:hypothetical protein